MTSRPFLPLSAKNICESEVTALSATTRFVARKPRPVRYRLLFTSEFMEMSKLTPLRHNEIAILVNRSAVG